MIKTSENVIEIINLYKEYRLGTISHGTLYKDIQSFWAKFRKKEDPNSLISESHSQEAEQSSFLALNNISLEIQQGDIVGIIGRNGAGKSTLLKVLSRITSPTKGEIRIKGRIGSLLEVGTGFHPELTGRENIYLNGSILGMSRKEIDEKVQEIIDFANVGRHIDTPVKRYSSGMKVRLAFSVAAHLDPEILIVDEVLAVGDAEFQRKCLGKMKDISEGKNRTVLFVSHNMSAIENLCDKLVVIENGSIKLKTNDVKEGIDQYLKNYNLSDCKIWKNENNDFQNSTFIPQQFSINYEDGAVIKSSVSNTEAVYIQVQGNIVHSTESLMIGYTLFNSHNQRIYTSFNTDTDQDQWLSLRKGHIELRSKLPTGLLNNDKYRIEFSIRTKSLDGWIVRHDSNSPKLFIDIDGKLSNSPYYIQKRKTILAPILDWESIS